MENPWNQKGRIYWKDDPEFKKFNEVLYTNQFKSFDEVYEFCGMESWPWIYSGSDPIIKARKQWNKLRKRWKSNTKTCKLPGYAAITLLYAVLPYEKLGTQMGTVLNNFEAKQANAAYFYEIGQYYMGGKNLPIKNIEDLSGGPIFPPAYQHWLDEKYNRASWWLSYLVYERRHGLSSVIDSEPAELI
ncbi:Hypothetical protein HVR_LOCUS674 [uncultured virus]|nr:Hypothetical protein HVR_LOCUS674 [uncultured virus]